MSRSSSVGEALAPIAGAKVSEAVMRYPGGVANASGDDLLLAI